MNIKCIALDLDRTTLNASGRLSDGNYNALCHAIENGVHIVIASGRSFDTLPKDVLAVPGIEYAITSNGAAIYHIPTSTCLHEYKRTRLTVVAACAGDGAVNVVRMDTLFHSFHLISGSDLLGPYYKCMCPSQPSISATPSSGLGNDCLTIIARIGQNARGKFKFFTAFAASSLFLLPVAPAPGKKASAAQCGSPAAPQGSRRPVPGAAVCAPAVPVRRPAYPARPHILRTGAVAAASR